LRAASFAPFASKHSINAKDAKEKQKDAKERQKNKDATAADTGGLGVLAFTSRPSSSFFSLPLAFPSRPLRPSR
jgi:hypothetical protein